jgi:hypothetical protein
LSKAEKQKLIEECRSSGVSAKAWCEAKGISYRQYVGWASRYNREHREADKQRWVALELPKEPVSVSHTAEIRLECGKWKICVGVGCSPSLLADVVRAVGAVC